MPVARKYGLKGLDELVLQVRSKRDEKQLRDITEAMTTNESSFFRDQRPFDQFRDLIMPRFEKARAANKRIRIWSAACSSGQEPYSLAMVLKQMHPRFASWTVDILGTDLSTEILDKARQGLYTQFEVQRGLPIQQLVKYFSQKGDKWQINDDLKKMVQYR